MRGVILYLNLLILLIIFTSCENTNLNTEENEELQQREYIAKEESFEKETIEEEVNGDEKIDEEKQEVTMGEWIDLNYDERVSIVEKFLVDYLQEMEEKRTPVKVWGDIDDFIEIINLRNEEISTLSDSESVRLRMSTVHAQLGIMGHTHGHLKFMTAEEYQKENNRD